MNKKDPSIQTGFEIKWEQQETRSTDLGDGFHCMREWQIEAFDDLKDASHIILNAPMGSGKSWMICMLSAFKMRRNPALRCLIGVPQTIIAPGFTSAKLQLPDGSRISWDPAHNLCDRKDNRSTTDLVIKWLETKSASIDERVLICTHATLVSVYKKLKHTNRFDLISDLLLWIDEAHHVKNCLVNGNNSIGDLVASFINSASKGVEVGLTTATFFRGDRTSLLTPANEDLFKRYNLPYDRYLRSMKHLKSFGFDFIVCGQDYTKAIKLLIKNKQSKDIVYIPHPISRYSSGKKLFEVKEIIEVYRQEYDGELISGNNGTIVIKSLNSEFKILDLVEEFLDETKKVFLSCDQLKTDRNHLDAIIALNRFKEGANWIWAERSIIVGARGSLVDVIQMMGRLFRDAENKHHVQVIQLLPFSLDQHENDFRENLNNYLKVIYSLLILEDILNPVKIRIPKDEPVSKKIESNPSLNNSQNLMQKLFPDETARKAVIEAASNHLIEVSANNKDKSIPALYEVFQMNLSEVLSDHIETKPEAEEIGKYIWSLHLRSTLKSQGLDVETINMDIIKQIHPLDGFLRFTSGTCDITTFEQLRKALQASSHPLSESQIIDWIEQYIKKYGKKPGKHTGIIEFAEGEYKGTTWAAVNIALNKGIRGLPGGSSLVKLIDKNMGIRSFHNPPQLNEDIICYWVNKFLEKYKRKPKMTDGKIEFAEREYEEETWGGVNSALWKGTRGLREKSSLASLIEEKFNFKNHMRLSPLSAELIVKWVEQYINLHGCKPKTSGGIIEFAEGEYKGTTWENVNSALALGLRGLPGGSTLAKLIQKKFKIANPANLPNLTEEMIIDWVSQYIKTCGEKPHRNSGTIEYATGPYRGITWLAVDTSLKRATRGILKKSSLAELIENNFKIISHNNLPDLAEEMIIDWASQYTKTYGKKPNQNSGIIEFATGPYRGITWLAINTALDQGGRGLPGGSSLAQFIEQKLGIFNRVSQEQLQQDLILTWIKKFIDKHGEKPLAKSGVIEFAENPFKYITWAALDSSLRLGGRGLPGGSSLAQFIEEYLGIKNRKNPPIPSEELIQLWVSKYFKKYGKFPAKSSGIIEFAEAEYKGITWAAINARFRRKNKFSSLAKFIEAYFPPAEK